jgi:predicted transcriptional regulator
MLNTTVTVRLNPITKRKFEEIAKAHGIKEPAAIYRNALYRFLKQYDDKATEVEVIMGLEDIRLHGGVQPEDYVVEIGELYADPLPGAAPLPTVAADPALLADLADAQELTDLKLDSMNRAAKIKKLEDKSKGAE